jgi:deoxycytidylate deaminase
MVFVSHENLERRFQFFSEAQEEAKKSTCLRRKCGSVLVKNEKVIGRGFNSPPGNLENQRRCSFDKNSLHEKVTDKICCVHAEQRAIVDALENFGKGEISESVLYFTSVDQDGNRLKSGKPYCTLCSKLALDVGVSEWMLEHEEGITNYNSQNYHILSLEYKG